MDKYEDVLEHYGILGMRWGVRRTPEQLARARAKRKEKGKPVTPTKKSKSEPSPDAARAKESQKKVKKGGTKTLSNQELQELVNRMNLEQQYSKLNTNDSPRINKGMQFALEIAKDVAKTQIKNELNNQIKDKLRGG